VTSNQVQDNIVQIIWRQTRTAETLVNMLKTAQHNRIPVSTADKTRRQHD